LTTFSLAFATFPTSFYLFRKTPLHLLEIRPDLSHYLLFFSFSCI